MGSNSHRPDINENAKPWSKDVTKRHDFCFLSAAEFRKKYKITKKQYEEKLNAPR